MGVGQQGVLSPTPYSLLPTPWSFDVLHLLAQLVDNGLQLEAIAGDVGIVGLRAQRVGFAVELLRQELELAPDRLLRGDQLARGSDVRAEPLHLLLDVGPRREQGGFLMQAAGVEGRRGVDQPGDLLGELAADRVD